MLAIIHPRVRDFGNIIGKGSVQLLIIYKATNLVNGKIYIGQTINTLEYRKNQHFREARCEKRKNIYFHNALNKYGEDNFAFEEIDSAKSQEELDKKERYWIKFYDSNNKNVGYNLDSGGRSGGIKSEETKRKIGETTKQKWNDPETAKKMRMGLQKGADTMKRKAKKYPFICPVCNKTFYYARHVALNKKFCSLQCSGKAGKWKKGVAVSAEQNHIKNLKKKIIIKQDIIKWILNNPDLVLSCPYNKISTNLVELRNFIKEKYGIKDWRSIFICFDNVTSLKSLLDEFKNIINISKENVC